jgi:hypothetical protein
MKTALFFFRKPHHWQSDPEVAREDTVFICKGLAVFSVVNSFARL